MEVYNRPVDLEIQSHWARALQLCKQCAAHRTCVLGWKMIELPSMYHQRPAPDTFPSLRLKTTARLFTRIDLLIYTKSSLRFKDSLQEEERCGPLRDSEISYCIFFTTLWVLLRDDICLPNTMHVYIILLPVRAYRVNLVFFVTSVIFVMWTSILDIA